MKKTFKLENLDCANCAAKMQAGIEAIDGVTFASVNFIMQKMTLEAPDERFEAIFKEAVKVCRRVEPDIEIIK